MAHRERFGRIAAATAVAVSAAASLIGSGCHVGPDYKEPALDVPQGFGGAERPDGDAAAGASAPLAPDWWKLFDEPELDAFEAAALAANHDLHAAAARVVEARAAARAVASGFYPVVGFDPSITRARIATRNTNTKADTSSTTATHVSLPLDLSYEVDVWGRVRREVESAEASARQSADDFGVVLLTLTADVANGYFALRSLDAQSEILARSIELFRRQVELTTTQRRAGLVGQTDVLQAQTQLDATLAQQLDVRRQRDDAEHALAILTGKAPSEVSIPPRSLVLAPPAIPVGLPSEVLRKRPDVASAEQGLVAANAQVGVAKANFYPSFTLTGSAGFESFDVGKVIDWPLRVWSIGASAAQPLFEGGRLSADLEQAKARYDELEATFRSTVLAAIGDVETSLTDLHMRTDAHAAQTRAVDSSREYLRLAELQYRQGLIGYLQVIDADRTLLSNELLSAQLLNQRFTSTVLLIKSLGGGWTEKDVVHPPETESAAGSKS